MPVVKVWLLNYITYWSVITIVYCILREGMDNREIL